MPTFSWILFFLQNLVSRLTLLLHSATITPGNIVKLAKQRPGMASLQSPIMPIEMTAARQQQRFLQALHYLAPALVLGYFLITTAVSACRLQNLKASRTGPRKVVIPLVCLVVVSFLLESCMLIIDTAVTGACHSSRDSIVSLFSRKRGRQDPASLLLTTS